jgi:hypothetical protein
VFSTLFSNFKIIIPYQAVEYNCIFCVAAGARRPKNTPTGTSRTATSAGSHA